MWIEAVGVVAPGLPNWETTRAVLRGEVAYLPAALPPHQATLLPPNERRRAPASVRLAFSAAEDVFTRTPIAPGDCAAVFVSSDADMRIIDRINQGLSRSERVVSPIDFHNTVHNAAAGYWSIAVDGRLPSTTLCAYDAGFAAALLEALPFVALDNHPTLLVAYDMPAPPLLAPKRRLDVAASVALLLTPRPTEASMARIHISLQPATAGVTTMEEAPFEALRCANPATRALPILAVLACAKSGTIVLKATGGQQLEVDLTPP
ncbi:MAG TPA: beta-ketoacyl synthase chain length factor [Nevskiaceae bacterium]|nr:beta-ketoacyl synthase chain length factor [Nevskiaceae bacterium]